ncbi:hypothetical protein B0H11DRAFT_2104368 [Mycena galericulata]|nr:hypothetical protein B0H11DRAFT_2104368 [Mycena galericulata]
MLKPIPLPIPIYMHTLAVLLFIGAGVVAQGHGVPNSNNNMTASFVTIGIVVGGSAMIFLCVLCCVCRKRRVQRASKPPYVPLPLVPTLSPHPQPYAPQPYNRNSEYPPTGPNAEVSPPPYVKEGAPLVGYTTPSDPPPPGIDTAYSSVYSPPPGPSRAHISSNSTDFNGSFRPPAS